MSTSTTGQHCADFEIGSMGVASLSSKRRLEASSANANYPIAPKQARKSSLYDNDPQDSIFSSGLEKCSSEFLTTSILARTLLTSSNPALTPCNNMLSSSPMESLKSSLDALPPPMFLESLEDFHSSSPFLQSSLSKTPRSERTELEFSSLLSGDTSLSAVTVLSPIDQDLIQNEVTSGWEAAGLVPVKSTTPVLTPNDQLITEDENGKSYFNLGPSEATVLAKKSSSSNKSSPSNSPPDQTWTTNGNNLDYLDESSSSSSCESISSEDLFNSCEEYDEASDDEEEVRSYKQQRSTVLHLSLCKLNSFRNQQCTEPSLHRSVLICNTLRYIEQEIRHEDEVKKNESNFLQSRETLPPFWSNPRNSPIPPSNGQLTPLPPLLSNVVTAPTVGHDPYLSSSLYNDSPYSTVSSTPSYDYNSSHRPSQTPFHTPSYNYPEPDLSNSAAHSQQSGTLLGFASSPVPSLVECDSGYGDDTELSMSSYYYTPSPTLNSIKTTSDNSGDNNYLGCSTESTTYNCSVPLLMPQLHAAGNITEGTDKMENFKDKNKVNCKSSSAKNEDNLENSRNGNESEAWTKFSSSSSAAISSFAQQESQCGMESLRTDLFLGSTSGHSIHHQLTMDSLISPNYSAT